MIAKNESVRIGECLNSLKWADELIVVDNNSSDNTADIAKSNGAKVYSCISSDFSQLRNFGKDKAHGEWLLYVDADEIVSNELTNEIREVISHQDSPTTSSSCLTRGSSLKQILDPLFRGDDNRVGGYEIRRKNYYLGHAWRGDEYILRLMRGNALIEWFGKLHETARIKGKIGRLNNSLIHDTHRTLAEMVAKTNEWSAVEAKLRFDAGHPPIVWWRLLRVMWTGFSNSFFRQGGWRAGTVGWIESIYQAFSMFITYAKLWERQQKSSKNEKSIY